MTRSHVPTLTGSRSASSRIARPSTLAVRRFSFRRRQPSIAAIWYERALRTPGVDAESTLALRYDLGVAQESANDLDAALKSFSQVYAVNIDYRDVADRIAAAVLKRLTVKKYVEIKDEPGARAAVRKVLVENLQAEEQLDADARQLLLDHAKEIRDSSADFRQLFGKVREKLARDRGFIL